MPCNKSNHRERLFREQSGLCFYCKEPMILVSPGAGERAPGKMATLDHLQPLSKGGRRAPSINCVLACRSCNNKRGSLSVTKFIAWRRKVEAKYGRRQAQAIEARRAETEQIAENANCSGSVADESAVPNGDAP